MSNVPTEFDDAICDGVAAATAKQKKHVWRVGDVVRIVEPKFVERVGYPLVWPMLMEEFEAKLPQVRAAMHDLLLNVPANGMFNKRTEPDAIDRDFLKGVCMAAVRMRGFGGNVRSLHYEKESQWEHYRGRHGDVTRKRCVKTGTRFPARSWQSYEGEWDGENGGLNNEVTHTLLTVNGFEIEAANVELVKAVEPMYYIRNAKCVVGNSILWWVDGGHGYTCDLKKAWKVPESKARSICRDRPKEDFMVPANKAEASTQLHVDSQLFPLHNKKRRKAHAG